MDGSRNLSEAEEAVVKARGGNTKQSTKIMLIKNFLGKITGFLQCRFMHTYIIKVKFHILIK